MQAAQALEPSTLIALQLLADDGKVVLVGDPMQLPATVISRAAAEANFSQSLFERLWKVGVPCVKLCSPEFKPDYGLLGLFWQVFYR
jgi:superfamily I DNA and/or RNA helicase